MPCIWWSRRARARNCKMESPAESSMNNFELASLPAAFVNFGKSASLMKPSRMLRRLTRASEHIILNTSASALISRLNTATGNCCSSTTCSTMFIASDVLPMLGRAAMTIISLPCKPSVIRPNPRSPSPAP